MDQPEESAAVGSNQAEAAGSQEGQPANVTTVTIADHPVHVQLATIQSNQSATAKGLAEVEAFLENAGTEAKNIISHALAQLFGVHPVPPKVTTGLEETPTQH